MLTVINSLSLSLFLSLCKVVADLMEKTRQELLRGGEYSSSVPQIDAIVLLDRSVDFVAALSTQLTYEGLINEFFGISYSKLSLSQINLSW